MKDRYLTWLLLVLIAMNLMVGACIVRELRQMQKPYKTQDAGTLCPAGALASTSFGIAGAPAAADVPTYIGTFRATAYCSCRLCCGKWADGLTASGTAATAGRTIASDWSVLPAGCRVYIDGVGWRTVEDTGSAIRGMRLDIYFDSHDAALAFGVRQVAVYRGETR